MVTKPIKIHSRAPRRLYLRENRKAKGLSATTVAGRMEIERESVLRMERQHAGVSARKQAAYAAALDIEPEQLWRLPGTPSIDAIVVHEPVEIQELAADIVRRLVATGR